VYRLLPITETRPTRNSLLGDFPQQCNRVRTFWYPVAIMAKADSIRGRCVDEFMKGLLMLFESGNHSNVKVRTTNREYDVHRAIVCSQSSFMQSSFTHNFQV
jgi:hypothetical protein